jgi:ParB family chromosome partitioning protein
VPVVVKELDDHQTLEIALVENLVREDLNPVEEALGYRTLADEFSMTQEQIAKRVGKSRPAVANALRLLSLPEDVIEMLKNGDISSGHAKALLPLEKDASSAARQVIKEGLSVRQTEALVKKALSGQREAKKAPPSQPEKQESAWGSSYCREAQLALGESLGRRVKISPKGEGGKLEIEFFSKEDLNTLAEALEKALKP